jgi:hypothetical protein
VYGLTLDRTVLRGTERSRLVKVWTLASDPEGDLLMYNFTVSGGKILNAELYLREKYQTFAVSGNVLERGGYEVIWDLSDASPGEYTITAGVDDGCGICGQTRTRTVLVDPPSEDGILPCPAEFKVVRSRTFFSNTVRLLASPADGQLYEALPPFRWTFSSNATARGNGSPMVEVQANRKQQWITGSFAREPSYTSPACDFSDDFRIEVFKIYRK